MIHWEFLLSLVKLLSDWLVLILMLRLLLHHAKVTPTDPMMWLSVRLTQRIVSPITKAIPTLPLKYTLCITIFGVALLINLFTLITHPLLSYDFLVGSTWLGIGLLTIIDLGRHLIMLVTVLWITHLLLGWLQPKHPLTHSTHQIIDHSFKALKIAPTIFNRWYHGVMVILFFYGIVLPMIQKLETTCASLLHTTW